MATPKKKQTKAPAKTTATVSWDSPSASYAILFFGALLLYGWTYNFSFSLDDGYILNIISGLENSFKGLKDLFGRWYGSDYRPITVLSFWLERAVFGKIEPATAHLVNVLLFGFLLTRIHQFVMVSKLLDDPEKLKVLAMLTCLFFLVHPNHVGVVANIKSRDNLLSMLFGIMATTQFILRFDKQQFWRLFLAAFYLAISILSKRDGITFLPIMGLVLFFFRREYLKYAIGIAISIGLVFFIVESLRSNLIEKVLDPNMKLAVYADPTENPLLFNDTIWNRISLSFISLFYYIKFLLLPWGYYYFFGYDQIPLLPLFHPINIALLLAYLALGGLCVYLFIKKKKKIYLFSLLFFLCTISYALNLVEVVAGIVADRYNFIASLGFCLALAGVFIDLVKTPTRKIYYHKAVIGLLLVYVAFSLYRTSAWKDEITLFERDIPHLDRSVNAHRIISAAYINRALAIQQGQNRDIQLSNSLMQKGEEHADKALAIYDSIPTLWVNKGICDLHWGRNAEAVGDFRRAVAIDSSHLSAINYIGVCYRNLRMPDSAFHYFKVAMEKEKTFSHPANNMIDLLMRQQRYEEVDSLMNVFKQRYPGDLWLTKKAAELNR